MRSIRLLTALELRSLWGINRFLHTRDKKERQHYRLLAAAMLLVAGMFCFYTVALVFGLCSLGLADAVPAYFALLTSLVIFFINLFVAGNTLFSKKGYELLISLPLPPRAVVIARFLSLYIQDLLFALAVMLPGLVTLGILSPMGIGAWCVAFFGVLLLPAVPLGLAAALGTSVMALSSRMKHKSLVQSALTVAFVLAVLVGSVSVGGEAEEWDVAWISSLAVQLGDVICTVYPPAAWFSAGVLRMDLLRLLLLFGVSAAAVLLTVLAAGKLFSPVMRRLYATAARHDYKLGALASRGLLRTLYARECKRYFSSSIYVTNTIVGPILGALLSGTLCFTGIDAVATMLPVDIARIVPLLFSAVFCMMTTTSVSVSMEGKQIWLLKSLPIPTKSLLDAKILFNLSLMLPFYLLSEFFLLLALKPSLLQAVTLLLLPALIALFVTVFGITVNLKLHSFDWEREEHVVKQSASALIGGFAGLLLSLALAVPVLLAPSGQDVPVKLTMCVLLLIATAFLYRKNNQAQLQRL